MREAGIDLFGSEVDPAIIDFQHQVEVWIPLQEVHEHGC